MAAFRHASTGYLMLSGQVLTKSIEVDVELSRPAEVIVTNTGDVGVTKPVATMCKLSAKNAVPVGDTERRAILRVFQTSDFSGFTYVTGSSQFKFSAVLESVGLTSAANRGDSFSFTAMGVAEDVV